jgi:hypothetical protein
MADFQAAAGEEQTSNPLGQFIVGNKFRLCKKIGSGAFGEIYLGISL